MFTRRTILQSRGRCALYEPQLPLVLSGTLKWRVRGDLGVTLNGPAVSAWTDQSGNAFNLTQGTAANQPTWLGSQAKGRQALTFDHTNDRLQPTGANVGSAWVFAHDGTGVTIFGAGNFTADGTICGTAQGPTTDVGIIVDTTSGLLRFRACDANAAGANVLLQTTSFVGNHYFAVTYASASTPDAAVYIDGVAVGTVNQTRSASTADATFGMNVGTSGNGANPIGADIAELLIYSGELSTADRQAVEGYLRRRYRIY